MRLSHVRSWPLRREAWLWLALLTACGVVLLALARPWLEGGIYTAHDLGRFYLPIRAFYRECLLQGQSFLWYPFWFGGMYIHGEGQAGLLHPVNLLSYRFLPLVDAINVEVMRSYVLLLAGMWLFLRRWKLRPAAAAFGAMTYAFSGASLLHYYTLSVMAGIAHLPFLLLAIDVALRGRTRRSRAGATIGLVLLTGSQFVVGGHPQAIWMSLLVEAPYTLLVAQRAHAVHLMGIAAAKLLGLVVAAVQVLPMVDSFSASFRRAPPEAFTATGALHPLDLLQVVGPYLFDARAVGAGLLDRFNTADLGIYAGAAVPPLVAWLWRRRAHLGATRPLVVAAASLALACLVLALGEAGFLYRLQQQIPLVGLFRTPARYGLLVHLASAVLVAVALDDLLRLRESRGSRARDATAIIGLPVAFALAAFALGWLAAQSLPRARLADPALVAAGPLLMAATGGLVYAAARRRAWALPLLIVVAAADQGAYGISIAWRQGLAPIEAFLGALPTPPLAEGERLGMANSAQGMRGIRLMWGEAALVPDRVAELLWIPAGTEHEEQRRETLRLWSVRWLRPDVPASDPLPRARLVTSARPPPAPGTALPGLDPATTAIVDAPIHLGPDRPAGDVEILEERAGWILLTTRAPSAQLLVLSEAFHPGWKAMLEDRECPVLRVYGHLLGCVVPPGRQRVLFRFEEPPSLRWGARVSLAGLFLTLVWGLAMLRGSDPSPRPEDGA